MKYIKLCLTFCIILTFFMACDNTNHIKFDSINIMNLEDCQGTGKCFFNTSIKVNGAPFDNSHRDKDDTISIEWGDGTGYSNKINQAIDEGICEISNGEIIINHQYDSSLNSKLTISIYPVKFGETIQKSLYYSIDLCVIENCKAPDSFTVTTYNTGLSEGHVEYYEERKEPIFDAINKLDTDIICLQEIWTEDDAKEMVYAFRYTYPHSFYEITKNSLKFQNGRNGLLILSKYPLKDLDFLQLDSFLVQRSALYVVVETEHLGDISLVNTHLSTELGLLPYLGKHESWECEQVVQAESILKWKDADIISGDFNSSPTVGETITAHAPEAYEFFIDAGYYSPLANMENPPCTWCDDNPIGGGGYGDLILDHVFFKHRSFDFTTVQVLNEDLVLDNGDIIKLSDHTGVKVIVK